MTTRNRSRKEVQNQNQNQESKAQEPQAQETQETQKEAVQVSIPTPRHVFTCVKTGFKKFATGVLAPAAGALGGIVISAIATGIGTTIGAGFATRLQTRWAPLPDDTACDDTDGTPARETLESEPEA